MSDPTKKSVTRVLSQTEARHLFEQFEEVHCYKTDPEGNVLSKCPGWNWELEHLDDADQPQKGGCAYKNSAKICSCLQLAADGHYVVEIRPKNEDDLEREREQERSLLEKELRILKQRKMDMEEKILEFENKIRNL